MKKENKKLVAVIMILFFIPSFSWAAPSVSDVSGTVSHGSQITISGSGFGEKKPAKPLLWDDGSEATDNVAPTSSANSQSLVGYSYVQPGPVRDGDTIPEPWQTKYRSVDWIPTGASGNLFIVPPPHNRVSRYIAGGHYMCTSDCAGQYDGGNNGARDVGITVPANGPEGTFAPRWYASWYYRLHPAWPACSGNDDNHKFSIVQSAQQAYGGGSYPNDYFYMSNCPGESPCAGDENIRVWHSAVMPREDPLPDCDDLRGDGSNAYTHNPMLDWVKMEEVIVNDGSELSQRSVYVDGAKGWQCMNAPDWFTNLAGQGIGSYTVGGYYRWLQVPINQQHSDAIRFFSSIYVDSALSRVMLCNNQLLANDGTDICEPQIPAGWSDGSITATVNFGKLPDSGAVYLFVFDENNNHNAVGYPVTIGLGGGDTTPPTAPGGLSVW